MPRFKPGQLCDPHFAHSLSRSHSTRNSPSEWGGEGLSAKLEKFPLSYFSSMNASPNQIISAFGHRDHSNIIQASPNDAFLRAVDGDAGMADKFHEAATNGIMEKLEEKRKERENRFFFQLLKSSAVLFLSSAVLFLVFALVCVDPSREIEELKTQAQLFQRCSPTKASQCILTFLPPEVQCSHGCRARYLKTVARVRYGLEDRLWGWLWIEGGTQMELERALGGVEEGAHLVVAKFGRGTSWRMRLGTPSWLDGWRLGGTLRWLAGWEEELNSGDVIEWVKMVGEGKEKGQTRIEGEGMPKVQKVAK